MPSSKDFPLLPISDLIDQYGQPVRKELSAGGVELDRKVFELEAQGFMFERVEPIRDNQHLYVLVHSGERQLAVISHTS